MEQPIIPSSYYSVFIHVHRLYLSKSHLKINNGHTKHINDDLGLPANCVYETIFSSKEPVTKIVPIDELSAVFPSFLHYFRQQQQQQQHSNPNSFVSSPLSSSSINQFTSNTFRALSTIPRKSRNNKNCFTTTTPNTTDDRQKFESPPENGEYMFNKTFDDDCSSKRQFYSLQRRKSDKISSRLLNEMETEMESIGHQNHYELLQLLLILLPNVNRRYLQLLIRLFARILSNKEICLLTNDSLTLKEHVCKTWNFFLNYIQFKFPFSQITKFPTDCNHIHSLYIAARKGTRF